MTRFTYLIFLIVLTLCITQPVSAHGGEPRLEIGAEVLAPGSVLEIRGVDFEMEQEIFLSLRGLANEIPIGMVTGDAEGSFLLNFPLPADLSAGSYTLWARTDDHELGSPPFTVQGMAMSVDGAEEPRSEEDGLLAALPTLPAGYNSTPLPQVDAAPKQQPELVFEGSRAIGVPGLLAVVIILIIAGLRIRGKL